MSPLNKADALTQEYYEHLMWCNYLSFILQPYGDLIDDCYDDNGDRLPPKAGFQSQLMILSDLFWKHMEAWQEMSDKDIPLARRGIPHDPRNWVDVDDDAHPIVPLPDEWRIADYFDNLPFKLPEHMVTHIKQYYSNNLIETFSGSEKLE
jgi:hypothetical protein